MKVKVTGFKYFTGTVDGKSINSGKLYTECALDVSRNDSEKQWAKGIFTEEWKVPVEAVKRLMHLPVPFLAELEVQRVGNGKEARELVTDVVPLEAVPARPAPAKA
ncbi:hypothetical protein RQP53_00605 [Paucibacter sp. APW11]|uniref:Uncharacterized protein n=1 Tax=Roseateles aquae TaxID=3077235 RepID=A0ABU3P5B0_9BURK|nr:hypothetical protein [Paucibacter sp. APW11]MDT8997769.1 hypothetical protein [Paucibacter sp. APW11]